MKPPTCSRSARCRVAARLPALQPASQTCSPASRPAARLHRASLCGAASCSSITLSADWRHPPEQLCPQPGAASPRSPGVPRQPCFSLPASAPSGAGAVPASPSTGSPYLPSSKGFNSAEIPVVHYLRSQINAQVRPWLPSIISHLLIECMVGDLLM